MSDILPLLLEKKPVPEKLLGYWCIALQQSIPVLDTQFFLNTVLPVYTHIGKKAVRREDLSEYSDEHPEFVRWLLAVPDDITHAVVILTAQDDRRVVVLFDRQDRRAEVLNESITEIVPPPLCHELQDAVLWIGRLLLRKLFQYWTATPLPPKEIWEYSAAPMMYLYLRLSCRIARNPAAREVMDKGLAEFLQHVRAAVETA